MASGTAASINSLTPGYPAVLAISVSSARDGPMWRSANGTSVNGSLLVRYGHAGARVSPSVSGPESFTCAACTFGEGRGPAFQRRLARAVRLPERFRGGLLLRRPTLGAGSLPHGVDGVSTLPEARPPGRRPRPQSAFRAREGD